MPHELQSESTVQVTEHIPPSSVVEPPSSPDPELLPLEEPPLDEPPLEDPPLPLEKPPPLDEAFPLEPFPFEEPKFVLASFTGMKEDALVLGPPQAAITATAATPVERI